MKNFSKNALSKSVQKNIKGGFGSPCDTYNGPTLVTCEEFAALPAKHQRCVLVHTDCFEG